MRVLVCGGRDYADKDRLWSELDRLRFSDPDLEVCSGYDPGNGRFQGADQLACEWSDAHGVPYTPFPAYWLLEGRSAGPRRNRRMFNTFNPNLVVAFPGRTGTDDMCSVARAGGVTVKSVSE